MPPLLLWLQVIVRGCGEPMFVWLSVDEFVRPLVPFVVVGLGRRAADLLREAPPRPRMLPQSGGATAGGSAGRQMVTSGQREPLLTGACSADGVEALPGRNPEVRGTDAPSAASTGKAMQVLILSAGAATKGSVGAREGGWPSVSVSRY